MFLEPRHEPTGGALRNTANGLVLAQPVELALSRSARRRGLLGRHSLAPGQGLLLVPCASIHTWFMRFPIDVIFATREGLVVKLCRRLEPWRLTFALRAYATVELSSGAIDRSQVSVGDRLELV